MTKFPLWPLLCFVSLFHVSHQAAIDYNGPTIGEQLGHIMQTIGDLISNYFTRTDEDEFVDYSEESYYYKMLSKLHSVFGDPTESVVKTLSSEKDTTEIIQSVTLESDELGVSDSSSEEYIRVIPNRKATKHTAVIPLEDSPQRSISPNMREIVITEDSDEFTYSSSEENVDLVNPKGTVVLDKNVPVSYPGYSIPNPGFPYFNPGYQFLNGYPDYYNDYDLIPLFGNY